MTSSQQQDLGDIDNSRHSSPEPSAEEAVRIVSNLPAGRRDSAQPVQSHQDDSYNHHLWLDEDDDEDDDDNDEDIDELEVDMDELQQELDQELDQDEWDEAIAGEAPQYPPGNSCTTVLFTHCRLARRPLLQGMRTLGTTQSAPVCLHVCHACTVCTL